MPAILHRRISRAESKRLDGILKPFEDGAAYLAENYDELLATYPEEWVAIRGASIVAHSKTHLGLKRRLNAKSLPIGQTYRKFLTRKKRILIL